MQALRLGVVAMQPMICHCILRVGCSESMYVACENVESGHTDETSGGKKNERKV